MEWGDMKERSSVLIVDDNFFNIIAMQGLLLQYSLQSDKARNGLEAQEMIKKRFRNKGDSYRLIIMDYSMPTCNGPQAAKAICEYLRNQLNV